MRIQLQMDGMKHTQLCVKKMEMQTLGDANKRKGRGLKENVEETFLCYTEESVMQRYDRFQNTNYTLTGYKLTQSGIDGTN